MNKTYEIKLELSQNSTVQNCITQSITFFNEQFKALKLNLKLKYDATMFNLFCASKEGNPKEDYPGLFFEIIYLIVSFNIFSLGFKL